MNLREIVNKASLWLIGIWVLALISAINQKVYNEDIPVYITVIVGCIWMIYIITKDFKDE
jgi:threonine/homoserine efflux transporter RhtA